MQTLSPAELAAEDQAQAALAHAVRLELTYDSYSRSPLERMRYRRAVRQAATIAVDAAWALGVFTMASPRSITFLKHAAALADLLGDLVGEDA